MNSILDHAINILDEIIEDKAVPKNIRLSGEEIQNILQDNGKEVEVRINSVMQILDEITNDPNVETFTRTQIWNVVSILESIDSQSL